MDVILGDELTEEIVKQVRQMNKKIISYSYLYDKIINMCVNRGGQLSEEILDIAIKINILNNTYSGELLSCLKDEIMMHFYYIDNSHSFTESLKTESNIHSERNAILKFFSKEFYYYRIPNMNYIREPLKTPIFAKFTLQKWLTYAVSVSVK